MDITVASPNRRKTLTIVSASGRVDEYHAIAVLPRQLGGQFPAAATVNDLLAMLWT